jgi:hypothetical protein
MYQTANLIVRSSTFRRRHQLAPKFPPEGGTPNVLLIFPLGNAAGRPGGAGCFHLFFQPREITFD